MTAAETDNRLTEEERAKIEWANSLIEHHVKRTGGFHTCLQRGLKKFTAVWNEQVRVRNARLRKEGLL